MPWTRVGVLGVYLVLVAGLFAERAVHEPAFLRHFTYWSLALSWVWAAGWVALCVTHPGLEGVWLATTGVSVLGVLVSVAVLITALPLFDSSIIASQTDGLPLAQANAANLALHYAPLVVLGLTFVRAWEVVTPVVGASTGVALAVLGPWPTRALQVAVAATAALAVPGAFAALYSSILDFTQEYEVHVNPRHVHAVGLAALCVLALAHWGAMVVGAARWKGPLRTGDP